MTTRVVHVITPHVRATLVMHRRRIRNRNSNIIAHPFDTYAPAPTPVFDPSTPVIDLSQPTPTPTRTPAPPPRPPLLRQPSFHGPATPSPKPYTATLPLWGGPTPDPPPQTAQWTPPAPPTPTMPRKPSTPRRPRQPTPSTRWTDAEDAFLQSVAGYSPVPWSRIARVLPHRTRCAVAQRLAMIKAFVRNVRGLDGVLREPRGAVEVIVIDDDDAPEPAGGGCGVGGGEALQGGEGAPRVGGGGEGADRGREESSDDEGRELVGQRRVAELVGEEELEGEDEKPVEGRRDTGDEEFAFAAPGVAVGRKEDAELDGRDDVIRGYVKERDEEECVGNREEGLDGEWKRENQGFRNVESKRRKKDEEAVVV